MFYEFVFIGCMWLRVQFVVGWVRLFGVEFCFVLQVEVDVFDGLFDVNGLFQWFVICIWVDVWVQYFFIILFDVV